METVQEILIRGLRELEIPPQDLFVSSFTSYLNELKKWNRAYNLTALESDRDIIIKHFLDSLLYLAAVPEGHRSICDVGSGAGFPGLPLAIVRPDITVSLIEPSRKKTAFLRHMKRLLGLKNTEVIESRAEELKRIVFDSAVTRALFSAGEFIRKAKHLLKEDGTFILSKGPKLEEELQTLPYNARYEIIQRTLPLTSIQRSIVIIRVDR